MMRHVTKRCISIQKRQKSNFCRKLEASINERLKQNISPKILNIDEVGALCEELMKEGAKDKIFLLNQFENRISPGVDETSKVKANLLSSICKNETTLDTIDQKKAIRLLGSMQGG